MSLAPGMMVTENVRLVEPLGQGGMGSVWVADHLTLDTQVAVKFISAKATLGTQDELLERFRREAKAAAKIKSAHVVQTFDHGVTADGMAYIVMELLDGESLGERLRRLGRLGLEEMADVLEQAGKALASAHRLDIVHRDVKPDNIFLTIRDDELFVKVLDFGVAKQVGDPSAHDMTGTSTVLGSPHYMSPEQLLSSRGISYRADLWGLAVVTYHAVTGNVPFEGETLTALCMNICTSELEPPSERAPGLPTALDGWFNRALSRDPDARFGSAKEMVESFRDAIEGTEIIADLVPPSAATTAVQTPAGVASGSGQVDLAGQSGPSGPFAATGGGHASAPGGAEPSGPVELGGADEPATVMLDPEQVASATAGLAAAEAAMAEAGSGGYEPLSATSPQTHGSTLASAAASPPSAASASAGGYGGSQGVPVATFGGAAASLGGEAAPAGKSRLLQLGVIAVLVVLIAVGGGLLWMEQSASGPPVAVASGSASDEATAAAAASATSSATAAATAVVEVPVPAGMVAVAPGRYPVGCDPEANQNCFDDEKPRHEVASSGFAIMVHEVTMAEYDECAATGACPAAGKGKGCTWQQAGKERHPINCVTWGAARAYCVHRGWRLPTEPEWEIAARGSDPRSYPWGDELPTCDRAVIRAGAPGGCGSGGPLAVAARAGDRSWVGALDMGGNVREWTSSDYAPYPGGKSEPGRAGKVNRGGSWLMRSREMTASYTRGVDAATEARADLGFRCAADH